ncbi:winged helix-turn-helix domain-containing protein [Roseobacter litoralis]|uniref:winged helix-turn-helix domain-containing protein n=1 Tax=Roseobacter litoralis TaxID=42443 RepID=UPI0024959D99|nr:helix-turn-helix domain-containing protein [Roseobacter litoralis]
MSQQLIFEPDFSAVRFEDGTEVKFTRMEKRALAVFSTSAGRVLSRDYLLDAISEHGSEKSDRNVDFLINRIRAKLRDSAKNPQFIETRYGEGYVWLFTGTSASNDAEAAFIVIAPLKGLATLGEFEENGLALVPFLQADFRSQIPPDETVMIAQDVEGVSASVARGQKIDVQISFFQYGSGVECVVSARRLPGGHIFVVRRFPIEAGPEGYQNLSVQSRTLTRLIMANYWQDIAQKGIGEAPLPIAMHHAAELPKDSNSWEIANRRLTDLRTEQPDDPALKMMWATHLHTKYVLNGYDLFTNGEDTCAADEAEIEQSVLDALDYAQTRPELAVMAAKLLYFVDQGYRDLALELAARAHKSNTAIASSLAIVGQLHSFTGDMEMAENYLLQAEQLSIPKSDFQIYALTLLCQAYKASGNHTRLAATMKRMHKARPATMLIFEPLFSDPISPSLRAKAITLLMSRKRATGLLKFVTYLSARLFENPEHRQNSLLTPVNLLVRRFGPEVVPQETALHLPQLQRSNSKK